MPTTYTSLLGLALPATGELSGTWGTTVNTEITSLLDSAVAGTTTLSTDADVTLTTTTGAANQARQAILLWTANGTVTRNITAPAASKLYTVINASAGTQSIVIRGVGPTTGVTIVKGESAVVAWNGSDFVKISSTGGPNTFTNLTVSGTTTLSGLTASTALALDASKNVVSVTNTGTGSNVLATSPTLVTPNLGTPSAIVLTNASGTASININGTVGATTPTTGAFTTLSASGVASFAAGTALLPSLAATGDLDTGMWFPAANTVAWSTGGSERMRISSAGNVGIGTTSPTQALHVNGVIKTDAGLFFGSSENYWFEAASNKAALRVGTGANTAFLTIIAASGLPMLNNTGGALLFGTADTERMRITAAGSVVIGATSPVGKFNVNGFVQFQDSGSFQGFRLQNDADSSVAGNTSYLDTSNNLGTIDANIFFNRATDGSTSIQFGTTPAGSRSSDRRVQQLTIAGDGNTAIGTTTTTGGRLTVRGSGTTSSTTGLLVEDSAGTDNFAVRDDGGYAFRGGTVGLAQTGYTTFTNLTTDRTCDADTVTVAELADIVGTLIVDLKTKGIIAS